MIEDGPASSQDFLNDRRNSSVKATPIQTSARTDQVKGDVTAGRSHDRAPSVIHDADTDPSRSDRYFLPVLHEEDASYFSFEVGEHLRELEDGLIRLGKNADDRELISRLFRTAHTLKGSAYAVGFQAIGDLVHCLEDFLEAVRSGRRSAISEQVGVLLRAIDVIRVLSRRNPSELEETRRRFHIVASELQCLNHNLALDSVVQQNSIAVPSPLMQVEDPVGDRAQTWGRSGTGKNEKPKIIRVDSARFDRLMNLADELMIGWGRLNQQLRRMEGLADRTLRGNVQRDESVESEASGFLSTSTCSDKRLSMRACLASDDSGGHERERKDNQDGLAERSHVANVATADFVTQLRGVLQSVCAEVDAAQWTTGLLREELAGVSLAPIGPVLSRFRRAVREVSGELGKQASLVLSGEQTEVDASILERIAEALTHLIRNAVYHGIESPSERVARGKSEAGTISVHAERRGRSLTIEVKDDGGGVDRDAVRQKALMMGLIRPESLSSLSEREILQCIFAPGFSTASKASHLAGRGVGLDVVKRTVEEIGGRVEVESHPNVGTTFVLQVPFTSLITTVLLVRLGGDRYAIPLGKVRTVIVPSASSLVCVGERTLLRLDEGAVEVQSLRHILNDESEPIRASTPIAVVQTATGGLGLMVDEIVGRQDLPVRMWDSLNLLDRSPFLGTAVDQDGRLILVIDPNRLQISQPSSAMMSDSSVTGNSS